MVKPVNNTGAIPQIGILENGTYGSHGTNGIVAEGMPGFLMTEIPLLDLQQQPGVSALFRRPQTLTQVLTEIWKTIPNIPMAQALEAPHIRNIPKTFLLYETLIRARLAETGQSRADITVVVAAHMGRMIEILPWLLLGVRVVGVEVEAYAKRLCPNLQAALVLHQIDPSRLQLMSKDSVDIPKGDIVQWNMPHPRMDPAEIYRHHKPDGYLVVQTDEPETFLDALVGDNQWQELFSDAYVNDNDRYLLPAADMDEWTPVTATIRKRNGSPVLVHEPANLKAVQARQQLRYFAEQKVPATPHYPSIPSEGGIVRGDQTLDYQEAYLLARYEKRFGPFQEYSIRTSKRMNDNTLSAILQLAMKLAGSEVEVSCQANDSLQKVRVTLDGRVSGVGHYSFVLKGYIGEGEGRIPVALRLPHHSQPEFDRVQNGFSILLAEQHFGHVGYYGEGAIDLPYGLLHTSFWADKKQLPVEVINWAEGDLIKPTRFKTREYDHPEVYQTLMRDAAWLTEQGIAPDDLQFILNPDRSVHWIDFEMWKQVAKPANRKEWVSAYEPLLQKLEIPKKVWRKPWEVIDRKQNPASPLLLPPLHPLSWHQPVLNRSALVAKLIRHQPLVAQKIKLPTGFSLPAKIGSNARMLRW